MTAEPAVILGNDSCTSYHERKYEMYLQVSIYKTLSKNVGIICTIGRFLSIQNYKFSMLHSANRLHILHILSHPASLIDTGTYKSVGGTGSPVQCTAHYRYATPLRRNWGLAYSWDSCWSHPYCLVVCNGMEPRDTPNMVHKTYIRGHLARVNII